MTIVTVWIAPPQETGDDLSTPWTVGPQLIANWQQAPHLLAISTHRSSRARGEATIARLRDTTTQQGATVTAPDIPLIPGLWIAVCHGQGNDDGSIIPAEIDWWGAIESITAQPIAGLPDAIGTIRAHRPLQAIAGQRCRGWAWRPDPDTAYGNAHNTPPTANVSTRDGIIVGNALPTTDDNVADNSMQAQHLFARGIDELSNNRDNIWTRWRLLRHLLTYVLPGAPPIDLADAALPPTDIAIDADLIPLLDDTDDVEVYDLRPLTIDGALDQLVPEVLGLDYDLDLRTVGTDLHWTLRIFSTLAEAATADHPDAYQDPTNLAASDLVDVLIDEATTQATHYDAIRIDGAPIIWCFTVGGADYNLRPGWSDAQQTEYATPAAGGTDRELTRRRAQPDLEHVGRRFLIQGVVVPYDIRTQEEPITGLADLSTGSGYAKPVIAAVPLVSAVSGTTIFSYRPPVAATGLFALDETSAVPYLPTAALSADLPILTGTLPGEPDLRPAEAKARPEYLPTVLLHYDEASTTWTNLLADDAAQTPRLQVGAGGLSLDIRYSRQEYLLGNLDAWDGQLFPELDWRGLVATIAVESDQRLTATRARVPGAKTLRTLVIDRPDLALWCIRRGTILGLDDDGTPLRATWDHAARNDTPAIERLADLVAAWAFRPRRRLQIHHLSPLHAPAWAQIGTVIGTANDAGQLRTYNSPIKSITRSYQGRRGTTIATEAPLTPPTMRSPLSAGGGTTTAPASPTASGPAPWDLGATPPQALAAHRTESRRQSRDDRQRLILPPRGGEGALTTPRLVRIVGGQGTGATSRINRPATKPEAAAVYDPATPYGLPWPDGIGYGDMLNANGTTTRVLLALWADAPTTIATAVINNTVVAVTETTQLLDPAGVLDPQTAWIPRHV